MRVHLPWEAKHRLLWLLLSKTHRLWKAQLNLLLIAAYGWSSILVHPAPVLFHRFHVFEFFIANVALKRLTPVGPKEAPHALLWSYWF